jgi:hypothetical protein
MGFRPDKPNIPDKPSFPDNPDIPDFPDGGSTINNLTQGDRIQVLTAGGGSDTGIFLRFEDNFLIWIQNSTGNVVQAITSLNGISISKL